MSFAVVHPGVRSRNRSFANGPGGPDDDGPAPEGVYAYTACLAGCFHRSLRTLSPDENDVLLILDKKNLRKALAALKVLRKRGARVRVSCRDTRSADFAALLSDVTRFDLFRDICS